MYGALGSMFNGRIRGKGRWLLVIGSVFEMCFRVDPSSKTNRGTELWPPRSSKNDFSGGQRWKRKGSASQIYQMSGTISERVYYGGP